MHSSSCFGCIKFDRAEPRGFELISSVVNDVIDLQGRLGYMEEGKRTRIANRLKTFFPSVHFGRVNRVQSELKILQVY